eukprot:1450556-Amphidinium_carterae.1
MLQELLSAPGQQAQVSFMADGSCKRGIVPAGAALKRHTRQAVPVSGECKWEQSYYGRGLRRLDSHTIFATLTWIVLRGVLARAHNKRGLC